MCFKSGNIKKAFVIAICFLTLYILPVKAFAQADLLLDEFMKTSKTAENIPRLIILTQQIADYKADSALMCAYKIQQIEIPANEYDLQSNILTNIGIMAKLNGKYDEANTYLSQALDIAEKHNSVVSQIIILCQIGELNRCIGLLDQSLQYLYLSRNLADKYKINHQHPKIYDRLSATYYQLADHNDPLFENIKIQGQNDIGPDRKTMYDYIKLCKIYADSSIMYSTLNKDIRTNLSSLNILGAYFRHEKQYKKAIEYFNKALDLANSNHFKTNVPNYYANISRTWFDQKNYEKAIETGLKGYAIANELNIVAYKSILAHTLSISYVEIKDFENALRFQIAETETRNIIYSQENWNQITELDKKYQTEQKQKEIEHQKELIDLKNKEVYRLNIIIIILLVVFAVIVAGIIYIQKQKKRIRAQAEKISEQYQNLEKLDRFKESLTHALVHDLKNPLSQILINTDNPNIRFASNKMLRLVMNLLNVEKYENTQFVLNKEIHSLSDVMNEVKNDHIIGLNEKNVTLNFRFTEYLINADKEIIIRVLDNLLSNAIRFAPLNSSIEVFAKKNKDNTIQIGIKNHGHHIAEEELPHIFDKYRHFEKNDNSSHRSTGLGLTFCKMAVEAHGQTIFAQNEADGVLFSFSLEGEIANNQQQINREKEPDWNLSQDEINLLQPYFQELQNIEVSHISDIHRVINRIPDESGNIINIKKQISNAVFASNAELYNRLITL